MTKDEVLEQLEDLFIITRIGEDYFITEQYKTLDEKIDFIDSKTKKELGTYKKILATVDENSKWAETIQKSKGRYKVIAFMDACEVPGTAGPSKYRLRGFGNDVIDAVNKIIADKNINPVLFIEAIKRYYKIMEMPKGFKNLILEGDALEVYEEFIDLKLDKNSIDPANKSNATWG